MSKDRGGPPPGLPAPPAGGYGPGKTVLAQPAFVDPSPMAAPPTVRDPRAPPTYGPLPPAYGSPPQQIPYGVPYLPPPPRPSARSRGPSMLVIGGVSAVVIGTAATLIAIRLQPTSDDKPLPTLDVPDPAAVTADPASDPPAEPIASADPSAAVPTAKPSVSVAKPIKPKGSAPTGGSRPGPILGPRTPPPRHGP